MFTTVQRSSSTQHIVLLCDEADCNIDSAFKLWPLKYMHMTRHLSSSKYSSTACCYSKPSWIDRVLLCYTCTLIKDRYVIWCNLIGQAIQIRTCARCTTIWFNPVCCYVVYKVWYWYVACILCEWHRIFFLAAVVNTGINMFGIWLHVSETCCSSLHVSIIHICMYQCISSMQMLHRTAICNS